MNKVIVNKYIKNFLNYKLLLLYIGITVTAIYNKSTMLSIEENPLNIFEYVLYRFSNHYLIMNLIIPIYFFISLTVIDEEINKFELLRLGKISNYFKNVVVASFINGIGATIFILINIFLNGIKYEMVNRFTIDKYIVSDQFGALELYANMFRTPLNAIIMAGVVMVFGLSLMMILMFTVINIVKKKIALVIFVLNFFSMVIIFKKRINSFNIFTIFNMNNYTILHNSIGLFGQRQYYLIFILNISLVYLCYFIMKYKYRTRVFTNIKSLNIATKANLKLNKFPIKSFFTVGMFILIILNIGQFISYGEGTFYESIYISFLGYGMGYLNLFKFLNYVTYLIIPVYFLFIHIENQKNSGNMLTLIRYKNKLSYFYELLRLCIWISLIYIGMAFIASFLKYFVSLIINRDNTIITVGDMIDIVYLFTSYNFVNILIIYFMNVLEILNILLYSIVFYSLVNKNTLFSFLSLSGTLLVLTIPFKNQMKYIPIGISSLLRHQKEIYYNYKLSIVILLISILCSVMYLKLKGNKKII